VKFTKEKIETLCGALLRRHLELTEQANLNGGTAASILGVSRSRYTQLAKDPEATPMLQTHIFLNLLATNDWLEQGLSEGWLPAGGFKGAQQQKALDRLEELAAQ
jgi:predicted XRE-type DNA-binding protein